MDIITVKVAGKTREAQDICSFELISTDGTSLPAFSAGSHIDVHINDTLVRQYSLCNCDTQSHRYMISVLRDPDTRGGSAAMHDQIKVGDSLRISTPKNHFPLVSAPKTLLLAGGIGITPLLCMAERLAKTGAEFELHYCARSLERTAFHRHIRESAYADRASFYFDTGPHARKLDIEQLLAAQPEDSHLYVCGPAGFIEYVSNGATAQRWSADRVHFEYFGAAAPTHESDSPFDIELASSGRKLRVPANQTALQVLLDNGVDIPVSCEQGVCGTCVTRVLKGMPDHRDMYFSDAEHEKNDQFTPCCSRARTPVLVLDL